MGYRDNPKLRLEDHSAENAMPLIPSNRGEDASLDQGRQTHIGQQRFVGRLARFLFRLSLVTFSLIGLFHMTYDIWKYNASVKHSCSCGSSVSEALSRNCKFDPIATSWLPPHCRDDELIEEFNRSGDGPDGSWTYYTDFNKTATMTEDEVGQLVDVQGHFFTTHAWHVRHCAFNWRKQWRQKQTGATLEARFNTYGHIVHCEEMFLLRNPLDDILTGSGVEINADRVPVPKKNHHHTGQH